MEENRRAPKPGPRGNPGEKAKDFKGAMLRLFKELKDFKSLVFISLILAVLGSVLSIIAPDGLSNLTDEISAGLVINSNHLETITEEITANMNQEYFMQVTPEILTLDLRQENIYQMLTSNDLTKEEKQQLQTVISEIAQDNTKTLSLLATLPDNILSKLLPESTYHEKVIPTSEKISFLKTIASMTDEKKENTLHIPDKIGSVIFPEIEVDKVKISSQDQAKFLNLMSDFNSEKMDVNILYKKIDQMPKTIYGLVSPHMNINKIKKISFYLACLYIASALFTFIESLCMTDVSNKFAFKLRNRISKKINLLSLSYFDRHATGDILSRVTNDVDTIAQSMNQSLSSLVSAATLFIGTVIMMFITNWQMALTAIISSLLGFVFMFLILGKSQKYFIQRQVELGNLNGHIEEVYSGLNVVKAYNGKKEADKKFDEYNEKVYEANQKSQFLSGLMMPLMGFVGNFGYVAVCVVGALLTQNGTITFGVIVAFITYVRLFTSPLSQIAQAMTGLQSTAAASERVFEFLDESEMASQKDFTTVLEKNHVKGNIEFKDVVFTYEGNEQPTITNFSAKAKAGQKIAIVGPTGAGKTTMVNLLMKFYDVDSGEIKIDGISTKELTRENIHSLFTMVLQDTWLFNGTIRENIVYNRDNISDNRVREVCKIVGIDHFIKTLPNGLDSNISDNDSVSAGQRQLLTIARGMIEDAPFLILDEATSNVDTRTEELVQTAMDKLMQGRTSFIIAHRLSTIKNADLILVMKDGNIIEQGNHEELMKKKGFYADLYNSQFEL